jgi:heterodisulfide reductase subunit C1
VKKAGLEVGLEDELQDALSRMELWRCTQCGQCTPVCPSARNDGIRTRDVMQRALVGAMDLSKEISIWQCVMCNSCSERCQLGVAPAHVITLLRNAAAFRGNYPDHFAEELKLFKSTGMSFPRTGLTKKMRKEFSLPELDVSKETMEELAKLFERTKLGRL